MPIAKQMTFRGSDFDTRNDEEIVDGRAVFAHEAFFEHVIDRLAGVVIGDGKTVQTLLPGGISVARSSGWKRHRPKRMSGCGDRC